MRGANRGSDDTLRWALVGGIVVVAIIGVVVAIANPFGGGTKNAGGPGTNTGAGNCLYPATVRTQALTLGPTIPATTIAGPTAKSQLAAAESVIRHHSKLAAYAVSRSGKHFLYVNKKRRLVLGTTGGKLHVFHVHAVDFAFSGNGKHIIYQKTRLAKHSCASLVLMTMNLKGKHKHLLLATKGFQPANDLAKGATEGVLQQDVLPSGMIVLVHGQKLYGFNPTTHIIGPLENVALGPLYSTGGTVGVAVPQFSVSPGGQYVVEAKGSSPLVYSLPAWLLKPTGSITASITQIAWAPNGQELAYPSSSNSSIRIRNLATGTAKKIKLPKKFHTMSLNNLRWSADGKYLAFTATGVSSVNGKPVAYILKVKGKHHHIHAIHISGSTLPVVTPTSTTGTTAHHHQATAKTGKHHGAKKKKKKSKAQGTGLHY